MPDLPKKTAQLFVIAAASGTGKTSLVKKLLEEVPTLHFSISHTTRAPRLNEVNGVHYHFIDQQRFFEMQQMGDFVESAYVHGNYYGTSQTSISEQIKQGHDVLLEIDWQGARQLKRIWPSLVSIFILPPSFKELAHRLHSRGQDSKKVIQERLKMAHEEMAHFDEFDHWLVNDDFDATLKMLQSMIVQKT
jgi:guanylate kinase